jgi:exo-1,4-beta-D-glucosaminidase
VQYSYDDRSVVVVNSTYADVPALHVKAAVYDLKLRQVYEHATAVDAKPDSSDRVFDIPDEILSGELHFVRLSLTDTAGRLVSENFYWIPAKLAEFDWQKHDYRYTPALREPDLTALKQLPHAHVTAQPARREADGSVLLRVRNDSQVLAFQIALRALDEHAGAVTPAFWSDNYVSLLPGESKTFAVRSSAHGGTRVSAIEVTGWNISGERVVVRGAERKGRDQDTAALPLARASASSSQPRRSDSAGMLDR